MEWHDQIISWMTTFILLTGFLTVIFHRLKNILACYMAQSAALAMITAAVAHKVGEPHLYYLAGASFLVKAVVIPAMVRSFMRKLPARVEEKMIVGVSASLFAAGAMLLLSHVIAGATLGETAALVDELTITLTLFLLGIFLMMTRKNALTQMMGILFMENSVTTAGILIAGGMSVVVELGIMLDVMVGILVMGTLLFRIQSAFASIETDEMTTLHG